MKSLLTLHACCLFLLFVSFQSLNAQGTGKVQEFFKKYFGEYFPKTTRSYTLYGNGLNGPADYNAGLPVGEDTEGPIKSIIIRRGSPSRNNQGAPSAGPTQYQQQPVAAARSPPLSHVSPMYDNSNAWQPSTNFDPVAFAKGGHRGRSDLTEEFDEAESRIITAEDLLEAGDGTREFRIESSMSFAPGTVLNEPIQRRK